jgi:hypothetical protein
MSRAVVVMILGIVTLPGCGCNRTSAPQQPQPQQFSWEVRDAAGNFTMGAGGGGSITVGKNALEIKDGQVFANGKDCGALASGDAVLLDKDGRLFVNGKERPLK